MDLKCYLPQRLLSLPVRDFLDAAAPELERLSQAFLALPEKELFASTAESWLALWEEAYGLPVEPAKAMDYRRTRLLSKMRGAGTTTAEMIRQVVASYSRSACQVVEVPAEYRFEIRFTDTIGIPPNMEDVRATIEEIKPAHLAYAFVYLYYLWSSYAGQTWGSLSGRTWGQLKGG